MKTMNNEQNRTGTRVKDALKRESSQLVLASDVRRKVIAVAERKGETHNIFWQGHRRLIQAGATGLLIAMGIILHTVREETIDHDPEHYMQMRAEVRGGQLDAYWMKRVVEVRTRNGREGHIRVEAEWPLRKSINTLNTRRQK